MPTSAVFAGSGADLGVTTLRIDDLYQPDPFSAGSAVYQGLLDRLSGGRPATGPLLVEAFELMLGRRHLTVVHGDPCEVSASRQLSEFYEELRRLAAGCEWVRVRGNAEYVTVTVGGAVADEQIALFEAAAAFANPGNWTIFASPAPPLS